MKGIKVLNIFMLFAIAYLTILFFEMMGTLMDIFVLPFFLILFLISYGIIIYISGKYYTTKNWFFLSLNILSPLIPVIIVWIGISKAEDFLFRLTHFYQY